MFFNSPRFPAYALGMTIGRRHRHFHLNRSMLAPNCASLHPRSVRSRDATMKRETIRVEPMSSWLAKRNAPVSPVTRGGGDGVCFRPAAVRSRYRRTLRWPDRASDRTRARAIETVPGDRGHVAAQRHEVQCLLYFGAHFAAVNAIYARYFPENPPARIFVCVPEWFAPFDIEIDCVAVV